MCHIRLVSANGDVQSIPLENRMMTSPDLCLTEMSREADGEVNRHKHGKFAAKVAERGYTRNERMNECE